MKMSVYSRSVLLPYLASIVMTDAHRTFFRVFDLLKRFCSRYRKARLCQLLEVFGKLVASYSQYLDMWSSSKASNVGHSSFSYVII